METAIEEMSTEDLNGLLRLMLKEGNPNDQSDKDFVKKVCDEIHKREVSRK